MLAVGFDRQRNVLLLTLLDTFDNGTLAVMDAACATFFDAEGPSHAIFDFTSTQKVVMAPLSLERRAHKPAMCVGFERIIVVPQSGTPCPGREVPPASVERRPGRPSRRADHG